MLPNLLTPLPRETLKDIEDQREGSCGDRRERWVATGIAIVAMLAGAFFAVLVAW
jgi:disulfide bond formation protein DsbB